MAAALISVAACGVGEQQLPATEISTVDSNQLLDAKNFNPQRDCRSFSVRPLATGTIRTAPQLGVEVAPSNMGVQSMYFETTSYGPETRLGVVEFELPALGGRITKAELRFDDRHGAMLAQVPGDVHELTLYGAVDGAVGIDDSTQEGLSFATFVTDLNELNPAQRRFDVAGRVNLGSRLGVRIALQRELGHTSYGSGFDGFGLDLTICGEQALPNGQPTGDPL